MKIASQGSEEKPSVENKADIPKQEESFFTKNKTMILVGSGIAVIGIGAGVYFYMKHKKK